MRRGHRRLLPSGLGLAGTRFCSTWLPVRAPAAPCCREPTYRRRVRAEIGSFVGGGSEWIQACRPVSLASARAHSRARLSADAEASGRGDVAVRCACTSTGRWAGPGELAPAPLFIRPCCARRGPSRRGSGSTARGDRRSIIVGCVWTLAVASRPTSGTRADARELDVAADVAVHPPRCSPAPGRTGSRPCWPPNRHVEHTGDVVEPGGPQGSAAPGFPAGYAPVRCALASES